MGTVFTYAGQTFELDSCPEYPITISRLEDVIASQLTDGYITTRPRISNLLRVYTLNYNVATKRDKLLLEYLESLVRSSEIFTWTPDYALNFDDYSNYTTYVDELQTDNEIALTTDIQTRNVRLASPIQFDNVGYDIYQFTINLQDALTSIL